MLLRISGPDRVEQEAGGRAGEVAVGLGGGECAAWGGGELAEEEGERTGQWVRWADWGVAEGQEQVNRGSCCGRANTEIGTTVPGKQNFLRGSCVIVLISKARKNNFNLFWSKFSFYPSDGWIIFYVCFSCLWIFLKENTQKTIRKYNI